MKALSEKDILEGLKQANLAEQDRVIKYFYQVYYPTIRRYIEQNSGREEDAADIFQDAMVVLYRNCRKSDFELQCTAKTYLYSICKKMWLYRLRSQKKELKIGEDFEVVAVEENVLQAIVKKDYKAQVASLLGQLGDRCQKILKLVYFDNYRMDEIATRLDMSSAQIVRNQKAKCMKQLRQMIEQSEQLKSLFR